MSIHVINSTLTFCWAINPTDDVPVKADFDIILHKPDGSSTYTDDGVTTYTAPTSTDQGQVTYDLLVDQVGRYQVTLSIGSSTVFIVKSFREVFIVDLPTYVASGAPPKTTQGPEILPPKTPPPPVWALTGNYFSPGLGNNCSSLILNPAGTKFLYMDSGTPDSVYEIDIDDQDITTAAYNSISLNVSGQNNGMIGIRWNGDGSSFWTCTSTGVGSTYMWKYNTTTNFELDGASYASISILGSVFGQAVQSGFSFGDSGNKIYIATTPASGKIIQFSLTTPYDPAGTVTPDSKELVLGTDPDITYLTNFNFNSTGTQVFIEQKFTFASVDGYVIKIYDLGVAWDISTATLSSTIDLTGSAATGIGFTLGSRTNPDDWIIFNDRDASERLTELLLS